METDGIDKGIVTCLTVTGEGRGEGSYSHIGICLFFLKMFMQFNSCFKKLNQHFHISGCWSDNELHVGVLAEGSLSCMISIMALKDASLFWSQILA